MKRKGFLERILKKDAREEEEPYQGLDLDSSEKEMIRGVVELQDTTVKEVLVPRIDVVFVSADTPIQELYETLIECGHSRVPVYKETIDNVIGILYVKDLLKYLVKGEEFVIEKIIRKPYFIPESKRLDSLLREFRRRHVHIAVAVDEYGGVSGIVCLEDIIEEIVGDIQDEFDNETEDVLKLEDGSFLCDARVNIQDFNEQTGISLPDTDFDTLGGFVFDLFGKIPVKSEKATFAEVEFIIQDMDVHKIRTVKVVKKKTEEESQDA